jgi:hypothetical protein
MAEELGGFDSTSWFWCLPEDGCFSAFRAGSTDRTDLAMQGISYVMPLTPCIARIGIQSVLRAG